MSMKIKSGWMVALLGVVLLSHGCGVRCCNDDTLPGLPPGIYLNFPSGIYQLINQSFTLADTLELVVPFQYELMDDHTFKVVGDKIYWLEATNTIYRADLDGGNREVIFHGGLEDDINSFDVGDTYIFYNQVLSLYRVALDGSNSTLFKNVISLFILPAIDIENDKVCWGETDKVFCSGADSPSAGILFNHPDAEFRSILTFYSEGSKLYWIPRETSTKLFEFDMMTSVNVQVGTFASSPRNIVIEGGFLYWYEGGALVRSPLTSLDLGSPEVFKLDVADQYFDVHVESIQVFQESSELLSVNSSPFLNFPIVSVVGSNDPFQFITFDGRNRLFFQGANSAGFPLYLDANTGELISFLGDSEVLGSVSVAGGNLYYILGVDEIIKADLDGSNPVSILSGSGITDFFVDVAGDTIYWMLRFFGPKKADLSTGLNETFVGSTGEGIELQVDVQANTLFYIDGEGAEIIKVNLEEITETVCIEIASINIADTGVGKPFVIDKDSQRLYFYDYDENSLKRTGEGYDCGDIETLISGFVEPIFAFGFLPK